MTAGGTSRRVKKRGASGSEWRYAPRALLPARRAPLRRPFRGRVSVLREARQLTGHVDKNGTSARREKSVVVRVCRYGSSAVLRAYVALTSSRAATPLLALVQPGRLSLRWRCLRMCWLSYRRRMPGNGGGEKRASGAVERRRERAVRPACSGASADTRAICCCEIGEEKADSVVKRHVCTYRLRRRNARDGRGRQCVALVVLAEVEKGARAPRCARYGRRFAVSVLGKERQHTSRKCPTSDECVFMRGAGGESPRAFDRI